MSWRVVRIAYIFVLRLQITATKWLKTKEYTLANTVQYDITFYVESVLCQCPVKNAQQEFIISKRVTVYRTIISLY